MYCIDRYTAASRGMCDILQVYREAYGLGNSFVVCILPIAYVNKSVVEATYFELLSVHGCLPSVGETVWNLS